MAYYTTGDTALATTSDSALTLFTTSGEQLRQFCLTHTTASVPFEISFDGGTTWLPCQSGPNGATVNEENLTIKGNGAVMFRRIPGGTNVTGIYAWAISG